MKKLFAVLLAVLMLSAVALPVFAADSPGGREKFYVDIYYHLDTVEHDPTIELPNPSTYTFTPKDQPDYEFDYYEVYTVAKDNTKTLIGTYNTPDGVTINLSSEFTKLSELNLGEDVEIHVYYKAKTPVEPDPGPHSPATGVDVLPYVALILVALFGVAFATRKLIKTH